MERKTAKRRTRSTKAPFTINYADLLQALGDLEKDNGIEIKDITDRLAKGIESAVNDRDQDTRYGIGSKIRISVVIDNEKQNFCVYQRRKIVPDEAFNIQFLITQKGYQELKLKTGEQAKELISAVSDMFDNDYDEIVATATNTVIQSIKDVEKYKEGDAEADGLYTSLTRIISESMLTLCKDAADLIEKAPDRELSDKDYADLSRKTINRIVEEIEYSEVEFLPLSEAVEAAKDSDASDRHLFELVEKTGVKLNEQGNEIPVYTNKILPITSLISGDFGEVHPNAIGSYVLYPFSIDGITRTQTKTVKEGLIQMLREKNNERRDKAYNEMKNTIVSATVIGSDDHHNVYVEFYSSLGIQQAKLPVREQLMGERYHVGKKINVVVLYPDDRGDRKRARELEVSRRSPGLVSALFEREVPEIQNGSVRIVRVAREAGIRTKIAVESLNSNVEALGTCIGPKSTRIKNISEELNNEKIDIIEYSSDAARFVANALSPAKVISVMEIIDDDRPGNTKMQVVVKKENYTLAIGTGGINAKLAAKLTERKIDIKSEDTMTM